MNKKTIKELEENNKNILKNFDIIKNELNKYETEEKIKKEKNDEIENIQIIKEEYIKEIEKYKEIIKQKDEKMNEINNKMINDKISLEKILLLQKEISELKIENNNLYLKIKEYKNEQLINNNRLKINPIPLDMNKQKIKNAYRILIEENERLKNNIIKLKEYYH